MSTNLVSFTPLMRSTVGFDRFNDLFESVLNGAEDRFDSWPPYNIEKLDEDAYKITLAVAGFSEDDLELTLEGDRLTVRGRIANREAQDGQTFLHRGIATRSFERSFRLADHIKVEEAALRDGLMTIALRREVPEEAKPRMIPINGKSKGLLGGIVKKAN